jgi:hypothetical protein
VMQFLDAVDSDRPPERPNRRAQANPA